jgi:hypothetical protein
MKKAFGLLAVFLFGLGVSYADPIQVGTFTGTNNFNFLSLSDGTLISNQFAAPNGVTFSSGLGGIYATVDYASVTGVAVSAVNFGGEACPCDDVTLNFSSPVTEIGFVGWGQNAGSATFTDTNGSLTINGFQQIQTSTQFVGIADADGISSLTISDVAVDDAFLFSGFTDNASGSASATPEPSSLLLLGTGLLGFVGVVRRKIRI